MQTNNFNCEITRSRQHITFFCEGVERLHEKESITPNMFLRCHIVECAHNYRSVYAFWSSSFERYNGILGTYQHNNIFVPIQIMRKFLKMMATYSSSPPLFTKYYCGILVNNDEQLSGTQRQIFNGNA